MLLRPWTQNVCYVVWSGKRHRIGRGMHVGRQQCTLTLWSFKLQKLVSWNTCVFENTPTQTRTDKDKQNILIGKPCRADHTDCRWENETSYISLATGCISIYIWRERRRRWAFVFTWGNCTWASKHGPSPMKLERKKERKKEKKEKKERKKGWEKTVL